MPFRHRRPLTDAQIQLLQEVKPLILAESRTFDMEEVFTDCGTPACIGGHCATLLGIHYTEDSEPIEVLMEVEQFFHIQDMPLFYVVDWGSWLQGKYYSHPEHHVGRAEVAIEAIDAYIANTQAHFANEVES